MFSWVVVFFLSKKIHISCQSSAEAEYASAALVVRELAFIRVQFRVGFSLFASFTSGTMMMIHSYIYRETGGKERTRDRARTRHDLSLNVPFRIKSDKASCANYHVW